MLELEERNPRAVLQLVHSLTDNGHPSTQLAFWPSELLAGEAYHLLGIEDSARLHFSAAERILQARLNQDADDDRAWGALGLALSRLGAGQEAVRAARHAVALVPSIRDSWRHSYRLDELARTQLRSGDTAGAMETVERLMAGSAGTVVSRATLRLDPEWDALRDLPRFRRLTGT